MPKTPDFEADGDERLNRLARRWFADIRKKDADEQAAERRTRRTSQDGWGDGGGLWDWLFGDGEGDACESGAD